MGKKNKAKKKARKYASYNGANHSEVAIKDNMYKEDYRGYLYDCANSEYDQDNW